MNDLSLNSKPTIVNVLKYEKRQRRTTSMHEKYRNISIMLNIGLTWKD